MKRSATRTKSAKVSKAGNPGNLQGTGKHHPPASRVVSAPANKQLQAHPVLRPELLAPCGSLEAFFAAMESGADAVYAGLREFSARARAKNFTLGQMERMLSYAHQRNRRIYITLNTLIKQNELEPLVETLAELAKLRVDGVIVQDMSVAQLVRNHFPSIPLHASTQMTIHNLAGVQLLEQLGFERVVLARELQLGDISAIASQTTAELEVFVHGALCFCVSGQCHFSSLLGGHSGNRGRCAQPCRRLYSHRNKDGYYFSPNDLSAIEMVPELAAAGVKSLKIEGRMKSADYVAKVVSAYRLMVDAAASDRKAALASAKELLKDSFGRAHTKGFLSDPAPSDIANPWLKGGTGRYIGEAKRLQAGRLSFETRDSLHAGDRLRLQPKSDMAGQAWTIREIYLGRKKVTKAPAGASVEVLCPFDAHQGDSVYKVAAFDSFGMSDEAANRKLLACGPDRIAVSLKLAIDSSNTLEILAEIGAASFCYRFELGKLEPARSTDMTGVLKARFSETGDTPFRLIDLVANGFPSVFIPPARLKEIRRELYHRLEQEAAGQQRRVIQQAKASALAEISSAHHAPPVANELLIAVDGPADVKWAVSMGADRVIVKLSKATGHALARYAGRLKGEPDRVIWQLPFQLFDRDLNYYREMLEFLHHAGFRHFEATNPGHLQLLKNLPGAHISSGYRLFSTNTITISAWQKLGVERVTLYLEDDRENIAELLAAKPLLPCSLTAYSPVDVMVTRIRIKELSGDSPLSSDRGETYLIKNRDNLATISSTVPFSLTGRLSELRKLGIGSFILDLSETPPEARQGIVTAYHADRTIPGTGIFNYDRGLV